jgi:hypothetical protein
MIYIYPLQQINSIFDSKEKCLGRIEDYGSSRLDEVLHSNYVLFESGKAAIKELARHLNLQREDEIFITTTTDTSYVSTCVSSTLFNYCRISRVLTPATKAIFVIHTFCIPNPKLTQLRKIADDRNIPLIEDCISAFDSIDERGIQLGSIGDYAVYSLPKIFPIEYGGVLASRNSGLPQGADEYLEDELKKWLPKIRYLKAQRRKHYLLLQRYIQNIIYNINDQINPFMFGFINSNCSEVVKKLDFVELGKTHVRHELHIPLNPFAATDEYERVISTLNDMVDK